MPSYTFEKDGETLTVVRRMAEIPVVSRTLEKQGWRRVWEAFQFNVPPLNLQDAYYEGVEELKRERVNQAQRRKNSIEEIHDYLD